MSMIMNNIQISIWVIKTKKIYLFKNNFIQKSNNRRTKFNRNFLKYQNNRCNSYNNNINNSRSKIRTITHNISYNSNINNNNITIYSNSRINIFNRE
jgi:hypothetical protein